MRHVARDRHWPWAVAGVAFLLTVAATPLAVVNAVHGGIERVYVVDAIVGALVPAAGALIASRAPGHRIGWVLLSTAGLAVSFALGEWSRFARHTAPGSLPAADWAAWIGETTWVPILALITLLPLWFPTGRVPSRRWLPLQWLVLVLLAAVTVTHLLRPRTLDGAPAPLTAGLPEALLPLGPTLTAVTVFTSLVCLPAAMVRYRRGDAHERTRLRWFALAAGVAVGAMFLPVPTAVGDVVSGLALALVAAAVTTAVLTGLRGVDVVVRRSLVYAIASAGCYLLYVVVVAGIGGLLPAAAGFLGVAAVAVAFAPLRDVAARGVQRALYGDRHDPLAALATVSAHLDSPARDGMEAAVDGVRATVRAAWVGVRGIDDALVASTGRVPPDATVVSFPLHAAGERVGALDVVPREGLVVGAERDLLDALTRPLAAALRAGDLARELQGTREQLVLAREDERRRLHRDLHDGLGPVLSHAVLGLDAVRHDLRTAGSGAHEPAGLATVKHSLQEAVVDLRRLVEDLRPPALDDVGLAAALAKHVDLVAPLPAVTLTVDDLPPALPAAVEVAAYRIATESLANAVRHAGATRCTLDLRVRAHALVVTVADDGVGLPVPPRPGVGLTSLRERAEELGGTVELGGTERGGGTVVTAWLPIDDDR